MLPDYATSNLITVCSATNPKILESFEVVEFKVWENLRKIMENC